MAFARIITKKRKSYVYFVCDHCKEDNFYPFELFKSAYIAGDGKIHCKHCGGQQEFITLDKKLEKRIKGVKR